MSSIYERITEFNKGRLPEMLQLKYKAMALNAFSFYRGTCHLFYEDLSEAAPIPASPLTWVCGDLHLENFGSFKGDDLQEYFDLNDFDEAMLAPALWEVSRMATSIFVALDNLGLKKADAVKTVQLFLDTYSAVLAKGKALIVDPRTARGVVLQFLDTVRKRKQKEVLKRLAIAKKGRFVKLVLDERHLPLDEGLKKELIDYAAGLILKVEVFKHTYKVLDCAFRLAGTGSIGVERYLFLLKRTDIKNKYLFLDMKQALPSSLKPYVTVKQPEFTSEAARVIAIQQRMQNVSPALLSGVNFKNQPYVVKQMQPIADKINFEALRDNYEAIEKVVADMAGLTASAQLRSGGRQGSAIADELISFGLDKQWRRAILNYAQQYAGQVKIDYQEFMNDFKQGKYEE
ncbi:MAG TPA: DUF2252 family protein [Mucilaginibacter sp.]|jgi:uncharacterized protein (DUF2252 family)|nr:DUF2252 family protein [Mucilaginibacter sp.]